jgi:hypothetical protein
MEKLIIKKESELKEMKKMFWQHYFENCQAKKDKIKEMKTESRKRKIMATKYYLKEVILPCLYLGAIINVMLYISFWLWL